jgi:hypothetical protein
MNMPLPTWFNDIKLWVLQIWSKFTIILLKLRAPYTTLALPTIESVWKEQQNLKQLALQEAVLTRPTRPFYREDDHQIIAEYEEIAAADPLNFNTEQMYEDLIAERQLAELLEAQAGMNEWWLIALPEERQAWLDKARQLQMKGK